MDAVAGADFDDMATVVGLVGHVNQWGLDSDATYPLRAEVYESFAQLPPLQMARIPDGVDVLVRSTGNVPLKSIQQTMAQMSREEVVYDPRSMDEIIDATLAARRFSMILLAVFAGMALVLASIGMYGVVSYLVAQHTREIGVRMALGADRKNVFRWVLTRGGRLAVSGAVIGILAAVALTQVISSFSSLLYGVRAYDPWTLAAVIALMMVVALAACYLPARRAMRIDPMQVLRTE